MTATTFGKVGSARRHHGACPRARGHRRLDGLLGDLHRAALDVVALYRPHITLRTTDEVLRQLGT